VSIFVQKQIFQLPIKQSTYMQGAYETSFYL
jgi:hypothetical protein